MTSEIKKGTYVLIIAIDFNILDNIEKRLQNYFNSLNLQVKFDAGCEFYKKEIINFIIPFFEMNKIEYKLLTNDEYNIIIKKETINNQIYRPKGDKRKYHDIS